MATINNNIDTTSVATNANAVADFNDALQWIEVANSRANAFATALHQHRQLRAALAAFRDAYADEGEEVGKPEEKAREALLDCMDAAYEHLVNAEPPSAAAALAVVEELFAEAVAREPVDGDVGGDVAFSERTMNALIRAIAIIRPAIITPVDAAPAVAA